MSTIVLTAAGNYWGEVSNKKRILKWLLKEKIQVLRYSNNSYISSAGNFGKSGTIVRIKMPLVVMLLKHFGHKAKSETIPFSFSAVFRRDQNYCQYWHNYTLDEKGKEIPAEKHRYRCTADDRTIDHILPRSRGGENSFKNTVCACKHCNEKIKKNRTPEEAGLELIRKPFTPKREIGEFIIPDFVFDHRKQSHYAYSEIIPKVVK